MSSQWNPQQYEKFEKERSEPFYDLLALVNKKPDMKVVDLGCGTGALTAVLHEALNAAQTLGIDSSKEMLKRTEQFHADGLSFNQEHVEDFKPKEKFDVVFSNACLQWLPDHERLFEDITKLLTPHGQLAVQIPANQDYFTHRIADELVKEAPFKEAIKEQRIRSVLTPEVYSELLHQLGYQKQIVRLQVYAHILPSSESLVEWVKGTYLTFYEKQFSKDLYEVFLKEYRARILNCVGEVSPFFLPFKRILIWGQSD